jgi:hypothetical protein
MMKKRVLNILGPLPSRFDIQNSFTNPNESPSSVILPSSSSVCESASKTFRSTFEGGVEKVNPDPETQSKAESKNIERRDKTITLKETDESDVGSSEISSSSDDEADKEPKKSSDPTRKPKKRSKRNNKNRDASLIRKTFKALGRLVSAAAKSEESRNETNREDQRNLNHSFVFKDCTMEIFIKVVGAFPSFSCNFEVIRWVWNMDAQVINFAVPNNLIVSLILRAVNEPVVQSQLRMAFGLNTGATSSVVRPPMWHEVWPFPMKSDDSNVSWWIARFLLALYCSRQTLNEFANCLLPSKQTSDESYAQLEARLSILKVYSRGCERLFPGSFQFASDNEFNYFLTHQLNNKLTMKLNDKIEKLKYQDRRNGVVVTNEWSTDEIVRLCRAIDEKEIRNKELIREQNRKAGLLTGDVVTTSSYHLASLPRALLIVIGISASAKESEEQTNKEDTIAERKLTLENQMIENGVLGEMNKRMERLQEIIEFQGAKLKAMGEEEKMTNLMVDEVVEAGDEDQNHVPIVRTKRCYNCGILGHLAKDCTMLMRCVNCNDVSHLVYQCPKPPNRPCKYCGRNEHFDFQCPQNTDANRSLKIQTRVSLLT